jgi:formylglycine-generating enzyme required for sulfatase activity
VNLEPLRQSGAPESVCALVAKCTSKRPEDRPQGMTPVCAELERIIAQADAPTIVLPGTAAPAPPVQEAPAEEAAASGGRPAWMIPALVGVVLLLAIVLVVAMRGSHSGPTAAKSPEAVAKQPDTASGTPPAPTLTAPDGMVAVPAGKFLYGEKKEAGNLPAYFIDKTEVTNAEYQKFCAATGHALPADFPQTSPDLPVVNVTFADAEAYAKWAGKRLPSAPEWEKAARGTDGNLFPWGNQLDPSRANVGTNTIRPANDFPNGVSPYGALQMVGNVWEWVAELSQPAQRDLDYLAPRLSPKPTLDEPWYQIRGQSFNDKLLDGAVWDKGLVPARWKDINLGFRCVKDAP